MRGTVLWTLILQFSLLLLFCFNGFHCASLSDVAANAPHISPSANPQPFLPLLAPSPLTSFTNNSVTLSGLCTLNFSAAESLLSITATDCWASFAPYLANVVCCPQLDATLVTLIGQSSKQSGMLALNTTHSKNCLSDVEKILESRGANMELRKLCSIQPGNLTRASCPVIDIDTFESTMDSARLLAACEKIDPLNECCDQVCQNAILDSARKIALNGMSSTNGAHVLPEHSTRIDDCKNIVLRWLTSKLNPPSANSVLRGLSNCKINEACPLVFPNMKDVVGKCGDMMSNETACCKAMESYMSHLQEQSFITNVQALNCAASLGIKLQKANVSNNIYSLCHINLKDFSLQVGSQEYGCLLPSLPSDATYDRTSGVSFICDLNDNVAAPWPSSSFKPASSCNKTTKLPSLPKATSGQNGLYIENIMVSTFFSSLVVLIVLL